jgi:RNA polymerase sigma-70 factor (ECF subfamily)
MYAMADEPPTTEPLLALAAGGDAAAWGALLSDHQERLARMVAFRMDSRLRGRLDPADIIQEAFIAATARRAEFFAQTSQSLFLWLRWMIGNKLMELHRHHLDAQMRDARREVAYGHCSIANENPDATRTALVAQLTGGATGPATAAERAELHARLHEALGSMDAIDREVLALRHYEQLTSAETAQVLGIQERAAAKRYTRALERLRELMADAAEGRA